MNEELEHVDLFDDNESTETRKMPIVEKPKKATVVLTAKKVDNAEPAQAKIVNPAEPAQAKIVNSAKLAKESIEEIKETVTPMNANRNHVRQASLILNADEEPQEIERPIKLSTRRFKKTENVLKLASSMSFKEFEGNIQSEKGIHKSPTVKLVAIDKEEESMIKAGNLSEKKEKETDLYDIKTGEKDAHSKTIASIAKLQEEAIKKKEIPQTKKIMNHTKTINLENATLGKVLYEARQACRLDMEEVVKITKLKRGYIEALENENFDALPPFVYAKAYVKSLCDLYKINEEVMDELLKGMKKETQIISRTALAEQIGYDKNKNKEKEDEFTKRLYTYSAASLVCLTVLILFVFSGGDEAKIIEIENNGEKVVKKVEKNIFDSKMLIEKFKKYKRINITVLKNPKLGL